MKRFSSKLREFDINSGSGILQISNYSQSAFTFTNKQHVTGPITILDGIAKNIKVPQFGLDDPVFTTSDNSNSIFKGWTVDMLSVLSENSPDLLIIGTGSLHFNPPLHIQKYLKSLNILFETQRTESAVHTFNVLIKEGRNVGALILPLVPTSASGLVLVDVKDHAERLEI